MCGIVGLVSPAINRERLQAARDLLTHRGPDDAGCYIGAGAGLAARRLSILDLAGGHQPLSNEDGTIWVAFNGEIVNTPALRGELEARGHRFRTSGDTELLVHAYEEWGTAAWKRLQGMFAFAIWDAGAERLLLVRDRFGIKPLYYAQEGTQLAFGSGVRPLFTLLPTLPRRANHAALADLFAWGFIPGPQTAFAGVQQLPAAHFLEWEQGRLHIRRYWELQFPPADRRHSWAEEETIAAFMDQLRRAVDSWRLSDVPVGSLLSGGVDSGALAALLTEISGPIHTFHIQFEAGAYDESAAAAQTAARIGSRHHLLSFTEADFDLLPQLVGHLETPQCAATAVPIYKLYRAAHDAGFKVILTGEGADELLGGYHWYAGDRQVRRLLPLPRPLRALLARLPLPASAAGKRVLARGGADLPGRYALWQEAATPAERRMVMRIGAAGTWPVLAERTGLAGLHPLHQLIRLETQTRLVDFINLEVDRMSMASSVEARPPFLDHHLWEFCATLPPHFKLGRTLDKWVLRRGVADLLPPAVAGRRKQGLAAPHRLWWRRERLPAWAEAALSGAALAETGYFVPEGVIAARGAHRDGRADHSRLLMGVLTTQLWHDACRLNRE